jgi:hypothetical protein
LLADISNRAVKELVEKMSASLSAASIRDYMNIVKGVVASAINEDGEELFPRKWNEAYIDAPVIDAQPQPSATSDGVKAIVAAAKGQYQMLYALLAGCGPLRVGEALGLEIDKHISSDFRTLAVAQKAKRGIIQPYLKTKNGIRGRPLPITRGNAQGIRGPSHVRSAILHEHWRPTLAGEHSPRQPPHHPRRDETRQGWL